MINPINHIYNLNNLLQNEKAAKAARYDEFIRQLLNGYETVNGENGFTFSSGERRLISIARALLKDVPVFLLEEGS